MIGASVTVAGQYVSPAGIREIFMILVGSFQLGMFYESNSMSESLSSPTQHVWEYLQTHRTLAVLS